MPPDDRITRQIRNISHDIYSQFYADITDKTFKQTKLHEIVTWLIESNFPLDNLNDIRRAWLEYVEERGSSER